MIKLIFVHIPHTGGNTVGNLLSKYGKVYNPYSLLGLRPEDDSRLWNDLPAVKSAFKAVVDRIPADADFLQDMMPVELFDGLFPGVPRVTILREPFQRVVAGYKPGDVTLKEFAAQPENVNVQHILTGGNLTNFTLVGDTDRLDTFIQQLAELLGIGNVELPTITDTGKLLDAAKGDRISILKRNKLDLDLWTKYLGK